MTHQLPNFLSTFEGRVYDPPRAFALREVLNPEDDVFHELRDFDGILPYPATFGFWFPGVGMVFTSERHFLSNLYHTYQKLLLALPDVRLELHWITDEGIVPAFGYDPI